MLNSFLVCLEHMTVHGHAGFQSKKKIFYFFYFVKIVTHDKSLIRTIKSVNFELICYFDYAS